MHSTLYALLFLSLLCCVSPDPAPVYKRCQDVRKVPRGERCSWVKRLCSEESREGTLSLDYLSTYYCHVDHHGLVAQLGFWLFFVVLASLLFSLLGDTAEKYFSPSLTQICQQVPKMRPRFAGVTVLAFANGAPDLSATINAIKTCKFDLSLGALTGAGMFVNCFVAGWIILVSGGARCRGATIRDVLTYFLTVFGVLLALICHRVGMVAVVCAFVLYVVFVSVVFGADEWHERGRPDFWSQPMAHIMAKIGRSTDERSNVAAPVWATYEEADIMEPIVEHQTEGLSAEELLDRRPYPVVWAQLSPEQYRQQALAEMAGSDDDLYDYPLDNLLDETPDAMIQAETIPSRSSSPRILGTDVLPFETEHSPLPEHTGMHRLLYFQIQEAAKLGVVVGLFHAYPWLLPIWEALLMDDIPNEDDRMWTKGFLLLRLPFMILQRATIPLTSQEHYARAWLIISIAVSPAIWIVYLNAFRWMDYLIAIVLGAVFGGLIAMATRGMSKPPVWSFGTSWPIGASLIALYGLIVGIFWIDMLAGELVDLLYCAGIVTGIPEAVLGLTVLAWGNSIGDFFTNTSIAKAGKGNMALTACYAGPVFNMLMGLGLGFISFYATQNRSVASIHVGPQVYLGLACLLFHAAAVVILGIRKGFRLPPRFGYFSIGVYVFYLILAVSLQFLVEQAHHNDAAQCSDIQL